MKVTLYCVGCGEPVCQAEEGAVLAIACRCGASAPILQGKDTLVPPCSLVRLLRAYPTPPLPHLEYYLGYSDHESEEKAEVIYVLRERGSLSQSECSAEGCRRAYERGRERWKQYRQEREAQEREEAARQYRIVEIGEP